MDNEAIEIATARAKLGDYAQRAAAGETFVLTRYGKPVAKLVGFVGMIDPVSAEPVWPPQSRRDEILRRVNTKTRENRR